LAHLNAFFQSVEEKGQIASAGSVDPLVVTNDGHSGDASECRREFAAQAKYEYTTPEVGAEE